jgi:putative spermidine/putrescine transport system ATP-binding protein
MAVVKIRDVSVRYGDQQILNSVSLTMESGKFVAVLGPSGCGKTTLLRVVAGFAEYSGSVEIDGKAYDAIPPHKRNIGIVFQDYALFPHKSVEENIAFGLRLRRMSRAEVAEKVTRLLDLLQLQTFRSRYPSQLSGGQRQRVAIARALAVDPKVLLLDEPLSALDKKLREEMQVELRQLQRRVGITTMFVTHDQEEALALADKVVVMNKGDIGQVGTPTEVYARPLNRFVANFIGKSNVFEAKPGASEGGAMTCTLGSGESVRIAGDERAARGDRAVHFFVRPEQLVLGRPDAFVADGAKLPGIVRHVVYKGANESIHIELAGGTMVEAQVVQSRGWNIGDPVLVGWNARDARMLLE